MSADVGTGADDQAEPELIPLGDGVRADYQAVEGGRLRLTFYAKAGGDDLRKICTEETDPDFYAKHDNERGRVKNRLLDAVDEHCDDDVSKETVRNGYSRLCQTFEEADVVDDEDLRSPIVNQLLRETESVEMHAADDSAPITVRLGRPGTDLSIDFNEVEWTSSDCGDKIRQQYYVAHRELIDVTGDEWETLRDIWNDQIERVVRDEGRETDDTTYSLIRRLRNRIKVTEEYDELRNDPKVALYDRNNEDRGDADIAETHGNVDVLWVQTAAISDVLDDMPGTSADSDTKATLARRLLDDDTLLRGRKTFGRDRLPVWAFDPERFGGRSLIGDGDEDEGDDGDRGVSV